MDPNSPNGTLSNGSGLFTGWGGNGAGVGERGGVGGGRRGSNAGNAGGQTKVRDITEKFMEAAKELKTGELVQSANFTLLEAVGALEIMDPKMDSGLMEQDAADNYDVLQHRLPEEIIGILDQLLSHEVAWHTGSALSQTLFTNLYLDRLLSSAPGTLAEAGFGRYMHGQQIQTFEDGLIHKVLRSYCIGLVKCIHHVNFQIHMENTRSVQEAMHSSHCIYEEEDIVLQTYNVPLLERIPPSEALSLITETIEWLKYQKDEINPEIYEALFARLKFRRNFLAALSTPLENYVEEDKVPTAAWTDALDALKIIQSTHKIAKEVPEACTIVVQRKLASTVPPRPMVNLAFDEAAASLEKMLNNNLAALKVLDYSSGTNLYNWTIHFMSQNPQPLPYTRSLVRGLIFNKGLFLGKSPVKDIVLADINELIFPREIIFDPKHKEVEMPAHPSFKINQITEWYLLRASSLYCQLFTDQAMNRSRFRRNLCHSIIEWDNFQVEAEECDAQLAELTNEKPLKKEQSFSYVLSSWIYFYKLRLLEWVTFLGFELDIYQPYEYSGMFWLAQFYARARLSHLVRISEFSNIRTPPPTLPPSSLPAWNAAKVANNSLLNYHMLDARALEALSSASMSLYSVLTHLHLIPLPSQSYSSDELRYELRMKPFHAVVSPQIEPFIRAPEECFRVGSFRSEMTEGEFRIWMAGRLEEAKVANGYARADYNELGRMDGQRGMEGCEAGIKSNYKLLLRSCIGISIGIMALQNALKAGKLESLEVTIDREKYHPFFPVPVISAKKSS